MAGPRHLLLSAYACDPTNGSEPGVGWQVLNASFDVADRVTLLTRANNADDIVAALPGRQNFRLVAHDVRHLSRLKKKIPFGIQLYYVVWQITARRLVAQLHRDDPVDVAHHVTIATDWMPTAISRLPDDVATIWGPVGGATKKPGGTRSYLGLRGYAIEVLRGLIGDAGRRIWGRDAARRARLTVAQNEDVSQYFSRFARQLTVEPNAFIDHTMLPERLPTTTDRHRLVGVGRLVEWKGWALAVDALALLPDVYRLDIYGTGSDGSRIIRRARRRGVEDRLRLHGWQPREVVVGAIARAGCLIHPSLHDSAPGAVAEALTIGTPVACLDVGGSGAISRGSGGLPVDPRAGECADGLATAVMSAPRPGDPRRWSSERLPALLTSWYTAAFYSDAEEAG